MTKQTSELRNSIEFEKKLESLEKKMNARMDRLEAMLSGAGSTHSIEKQSRETTDDVIAKNVNGKFVKNAILFALLEEDRQSKTQIQKKLERLGVPYGSWFTGGNFKQRLVRTGIVVEDGKNENGEQLFSLSIRGKTITKEMFEAIKNKSAPPISR